jgi:GDPmannose 4,6-dehydratase
MKALICGVGGQDGAYLAKLLLEKGYEVIGTSRNAKAASFGLLRQLGILNQVQTVSMTGNDFSSVLHTLKRYTPDEVYNLAGQSSVGLSFDQPVETMESIASATLNLLEAIRFIGQPVKFYNAGSSECFGDTGNSPANEFTHFLPHSPYAVAKVAAYWTVNIYREVHGLFACTGILFNHESALRPDRFVTQKIVHAAARISQGSSEKLNIGNITIERDWGWAPDYVDAMWRILNARAPDDYVIATGRTVSLEYFTEHVFGHFNLNWRDHVAIDSSLLRPTDIIHSGGDPSKANKFLGWSHTKDVDAVITLMCEHAGNVSER